MNDFEKRLSDISHGITEKTVLPDAEQLLDTAKKESATKGKKIERRNAFRRNFIPAVAMIMLSVVFISGVYYYITHGSLRNPGSTNPTTESSTQPITLSIDPNPLSYSETEQDGLVLSVSLDKTDYLIGEPIDITFALENNSGKSIYQENAQPSEDNKFSVIAVICDVDENPLYQYTCGNGIDDIAIYELKNGERVERNFKYPPSDFNDTKNQIINPGIYSVKVSAHYTFTDLSGTSPFEPTVIETDCDFFVGTVFNSVAKTEQDGLTLSVETDKSVYNLGEPVEISFGLENNSGKTIYQHSPSPTTDKSLYVEASIFNSYGVRMYRYNNYAGVDVMVKYDLKNGETLDHDFTFDVLQSGIYSVKVLTHYTFTDFSGGDFEPTVIETECDFCIIKDEENSSQEY